MTNEAFDIHRENAPEAVDNYDIHEILKTHSKVLVVEDDPALEPIWRHVIGAVDPQIEMIWAGSVAEAERFIEYYKNTGGGLSLVIADIYLIERDRTGMDLWKKHGQQGDLKFIMVSSVSLGNFLKMVGSDPIHPAYLQKPLDLTECVPLVKGMLNYARGGA